MTIKIAPDVPGTPIGADRLPRRVQAPEGVTYQDMANALEVCVRAGLIEPHPAGWAIQMKPLRWRVIGTDTERITGIAPTCGNQSDANGPHRIGDYPGGAIADTCGVYDCCPGPHIECWNEHNAEQIVDLLNATGAEMCS